MPSSRIYGSPYELVGQIPVRKTRGPSDRKDEPCTTEQINDTPREQLRAKRGRRHLPAVAVIGSVDDGTR